ncbi:MAG: phosphohydrolase [Rhodospirillaceae bacterium]|nr:phosphohydrolase [Rhodospirillaceae bacterium]HAA92234.1 phosphohydrolase [Rhodospirillaceae bacterium]
MSREYPDRPFAGVGVVVWRDGQILIAERGKAPRRGHWSIPGGGQELGETLQEAARREVREETGVEIEILGLIDVVDSIRHDDDGKVQFHYSLVDYAAIWVSGELCPGDDAIDCRWADPEEAMQIIRWGQTRRIIEASRAFLPK